MEIPQSFNFPLNARDFRDSLGSRFPLEPSPRWKGSSVPPAVGRGSGDGLWTGTARGVPHPMGKKKMKLLFLGVGGASPELQERFLSFPISRGFTFHGSCQGNSVK